MKTYLNLYGRLCSWENLEDAYWKARKHKSKNPKIQEFEKHWRLHLCILMLELRDKTYKPFPLKTFILRDPKTRTICVSEFRDRVVHHALVNILHPIFEPRFIHDSYASRKSKGTLKALNRFDSFKSKVSKNGRLINGAKDNNEVQGFVLKADIKHYFDTVDHKILIRIIVARIKDEGIIWLIRSILENYYCGTPGKGMSLGNWTSQFFANIYLNELDQFVKHQLKVKHYIRYVDDFLILDASRARLQTLEREIRKFLRTLRLEIHPTKCGIIPLARGVSFLGFRNFYHYRLPRSKNLRKIRMKLEYMTLEYSKNKIGASDIFESLNGWNAYAMHGNTYQIREQIKNRILKSLEKTANEKLKCNSIPCMGDSSC